MKFEKQKPCWKSMTKIESCVRFRLENRTVCQSSDDSKLTSERSPPQLIGGNASAN